jgi:hypothetical protein
MATGKKSTDSPKTVPTGADVEEFISGVAKAVRRRDAQTLLELMERVTGQAPVMWGPSMVGFGTYRYRYASGREGDWPAIAFSPRSAASTVYINDGFEGREELLAKLGPHSTGVSCLYLKKLDDIDLDVLEELVSRSYRHVVGGSFGGAAQS